MNVWTTFWNRGGVWRALLVAAVYLALYLVIGRLIGHIFADQIDTDDLFDTPQSVFFGLTAALIGGGAILVGFLLSTGWFRRLFVAQRIRGRGWMWIAPITIAAAIVLRLLGIPYGDYSAAVLAITFLTGPLIGFAEEVLTRGIVVKMLRDAGKPEWVVMVLSSLIFASLHTANLLSGMALSTVAVTVVFTFGFGICMYLTLRVTGNLIFPIILHGLYDPTLFLASGGVDKTKDGGSESVFLALASPANILIVLIGVVALILVRSRVRGSRNPK